jgi:membrane fusion protein (multidrug efflux system)
MHHSLKRWHSVQLALLAAVALSLVSSCHRRQPATPLAPPDVQVASVTALEVPLSVDFVGQLESPQEVEVRARVEAFVDRILFVEGKQVQKGDLLFELDSKPFQSRLDAAQAALAQARATLKKSQEDVARLSPLAERRAIPRQDLDDALAAVEVERERVVSAEAAVASAELDLGYCQVQAPISGLIGSRQVSVGSLVGKGEPTLLATISELDPIWLSVSISEEDYLQVSRKAQEHQRMLGELPVAMVLPDGTDYSDVGKWVFLDRVVNATTGTLRAKAEFSNPNGLLRPGMFARARVAIRPEQKSILVPEQAVLELVGKNFVWVVDDADRASQRLVSVGRRVGGNLVVEKGVVPGERIIVAGMQKAREGAPVQPRFHTDAGGSSPPEGRSQSAGGKALIQ